MAELTKPCPNCDTFVLEETRQCLRCGFRFDTHKVEPIERQPMDSEEHSTTREVECRECGAPVREHLVRCWKCSAFMRPEIAQRYEEMRARQPQVDFQPLPDWEIAAQREEAETYAMASSGEPGTGESAVDEDDFEVDGATDEPEFEDDFETDAELEDEIEGAAPPVRRGSEEAPPVRRGSDEVAAVGPGETPDEGAAATEESPPGEAGADALLDIAIQEEKEETARREREEKIRRKRAAERKRARALGIRPKGVAKKKSGPVAGRYKFWLNDVPLHVADPKKVKPKPGVLEKPTQTVDLAFAEEGLLVLSYVKEKKSLLGKAVKPEEARKAAQEHLKKDKPLEELPAERHWLLAAEVARAPAFEQPNEYAHETVFGGVPVFGEGHIAVRLPDGEEGEPKRFLVFTLTTFRRFSKYAGGTFGPKGLGSEKDVPLADETEKLVCHYTEQPLEPLLRTGYYKADPEIELKLVGRRCQNCQLVVSEDGRKKERIGGKTGSGIAKAKCPKCGEKFGDVSLYERAVKTPARKKAAASA
jgi:rubredoxin/(2Fe-2S) ferredoxin